MTALPVFRSAVYRLSPRIYHADRDNNLGVEITDKVTSARVDYDIDRQGAKGQLQIAAWQDTALPAGQWIAPFLDIVQEGVGTTTSQMGLFQLMEPTVTSTGKVLREADATGQDIIHVIEKAVLREPDVTPKAQNVMDDVRRAVEIATCRGRGPELVPNGEFTSNLTGWVNGSNLSPSYTATHNNNANQYGRKRGVLRHQINSGSPAGSNCYTYVSQIAFPPGAEWFRAEARALVSPANVTTQLSIIFMNASLVQIERHNHFITHAQANVWSWHRIHAKAPEGTAFIRILLYTFESPGVTVIGVWDDASVRTIVTPPVTRHAFPDYPKAASTAIPHHANVSWLTRINDMLKSIGHHATHTTLDGRPTTRRMRDPRSDTAARTYVQGNDLRITGPVRTERSASNLYNVVVAVKEDFETGVAWVKTAVNDDPDHPWSTLNIGEIAPTNPVQANDAVDEAELQVIADDYLAEASVQQTVSMEVLPDPSLTTYDVINIIGTDGPEFGRWGIESIMCGLTADNPIVQMTARRVYTTNRPE